MVDEKIITTKEFATACRKAIPEGISACIFFLF